jgi:VIT1/CCC1 family predicted Fe2+/Mn2+ transporter
LALPQLDVDANELALVYRARGMSESEAQDRACEVLSSGAPGFSGHPNDATPSTEGQDAVGTGLGAAASSFCFFATGALVPVLPYLLGLQGLVAVIVASVLVGIVLLTTGVVVGLLSGGAPLRRALRQLLIGYGAAAVTYLLGLLFGAGMG